MRPYSALAWEGRSTQMSSGPEAALGSRHAATGRVAIRAAKVPRPLTSFVGRAGEVDEVARALGEQRLVTLTGVGGCGKTRLAIQVLGRLEAVEIRWVDLGSIQDGASVAPLVAEALGVMVEPGGDPLAAISVHVGDSRLLLCLDTCEHLLESCAVLADTLLRVCPGLYVLATSREPLWVEGETVWRVPSLSQEDGMKLFRARAAQVAEPISPVHLQRVQDICARLDGIPLAIELAAGWLRVLTPAQIAAGLHNAFDLLVVAPRAALARQQTLTASMQWSHALLDEADRLVFRRLGAFSGPFTLSAALAVCTSDDLAEAKVLPVIGRLVDKSLVVKVGVTEEARLRLLDTVRQYALERLAEAGEVEEVRDRHLLHYLDLAERAEAGLEEDQDLWRSVLDAESTNTRLALEWGLQGTGERTELGRRLAAAMARYWFIRGQTQEGLGFLQRAVDLAAGEEGLLQARLLTGSAMVGMVAGRREDIPALATRAEGMGNARTDGRATLMRAYHQFFVDFQKCQDLCRQASELAGEMDPFVRDWSLVLEAYSLQTRERPECIDLARRSYELALPRGDRFCAAFARGVELYECLIRGQVERAHSLGEEALEILAPAGDYFAIGTNTTNLAYVEAWRGNLEAALSLMRPIVRSLEEPDVDVVGFPVTMSQIHIFAGNLEAARRWAERGTRVQAPHIDVWTAARCLPVLAEALRRLGRLEEAADAARRGVEAGQDFEAPIITGRSLTQQAILATEHDLAMAWNLQHEALAAVRQAGLSTLYPECLESLANIAARADRTTDGVRLLAAATTARAVVGAPRPPVEASDHEGLIERLQEATGDEFDALWEEGAGLDLNHAVTYAARGRGPRNRPGSGWASLTPAELDVARLVVEGLANPQISGRLFVSRSTVKTHLEHIYAKLGISNRTELASLASSRFK